MSGIKSTAGKVLEKTKHNTSSLLPSGSYTVVFIVGLGLVGKIFWNYFGAQKWAVSVRMAEGIQTNLITPGIKADLQQDNLESDFFFASGDVRKEVTSALMGPHLQFLSHRDRHEIVDPSALSSSCCFISLCLHSATHTSKS